MKKGTVRSFRYLHISFSSAPDFYHHGCLFTLLEKSLSYIVALSSPLCESIPTAISSEDIIAAHFLRSVFLM